MDVFASSGGAINALALVAAHPDDVRTLVAHEPPIAEVLPDAEQVVAACHDMYDTYQRSGRGPATCSSSARAAGFPAGSARS